MRSWSGSLRAGLPLGGRLYLCSFSFLIVPSTATGSGLALPGSADIGGLSHLWGLAVRLKELRQRLRRAAKEGTCSHWASNGGNGHVGAAW